MQYRITETDVQRFDNTSVVLWLYLEQQDSYSVQAGFYVDHHKYEIQQHGQRVLAAILRHIDLTNIEDDSELVGKSIDAATFRSIEKSPALHRISRVGEHLAYLMNCKSVVNPPRSEQHDNDRYVYVISCVDTPKPICKIGIAGSPEKRLKQLSTSSPHALRIEFTRYADNARQVERAAHANFSDKRQNGEWFSIPPSTAISFVNDNIDKAAA